ncbi:zinc finger protein 318 isoform X2 [Grammomys surdaster]|uniref:zinc finger protein 318 isoform X2 n=1 Tax=Grammomys surdaster TaxID=491861 RepID=UPI00109F68C5|nr:zinc finger protein 318 isoform X2 [Grammomys surdaster]XP_028622364.1 zinc finger protein 318 isoform X2 [Grammomys surdaster]
MYRSGSRSSVSSHRPKDGSASGPPSGRPVGASSGPARRPSSPPPSCSSLRLPTRRHRSPSGHRGRWASPSPPRGRRGSPSPPRGRRASPSPPRGRRASPSPPRGRRVSPSPPRARRGSPSPPRSRRHYPPGLGGFRGSIRGESRADFARDGRGDHPGDGGSRRRSPGLCSDSSLEQSLRITVGNDHFCVSTPERRRLSDRLGSPVDGLEDMDRDDLTDDSVFARSSQCSRGLERYISREEGPHSPFLGQLDEDYRTRETFLHRSEYSPQSSCHDELLRGTERNRDKLKSSSYCTRSEERSREAKRPRYDDTEKAHSTGGDHSSLMSGTRNYRQRRSSPTPRFLDPEFRELDLARRKREEEEQSRNLSQELVGVDNDQTGCSIPGLSGVLTPSEPGYSLQRPEEIPVMPKKSILKKRIEVDVKPSLQLESFSSGTSSSEDRPLYSEHSPLPLSGAIAAFTSEIENKRTTVEADLKEPQSNLYQWGPLHEIPKDNSEKFDSFLCFKEKLDLKAEGLEQQTDFLLPHERASQDGSGFSRILSMLADPTSTQEKRRRSFPDIEDEEKFLYGDEEEDIKSESPPKSLEDPKSTGTRQKANSLPSTPAVKLESLEESNPEYAKIHDLLKTIGLDIGVAEIGKLAARTQERLHGKKPSSRPLADRRSSADRHLSADRHFSADRCSSVDHSFTTDWRSSDPHRPESREAHQNTQSPEGSHPHPASPVDPYLHTKNSPPFLKSDHPVSHGSGPEVVGSGFQSSVAVRCMLPSAPSTPIRLSHSAALSQFHIPRASQFAAAQIPPSYQGSVIPSASFDAYRHYMAYAASRWPLYPAAQPPGQPSSDPHRLMPATRQATRSSRPNLRVIPTVTPTKPKQEIPVLGSISVKRIPVRVSIPSLIRYNPKKISDEKNRASQKQKVIEEREKLKTEQEARQKKMFYLRTELERLHKQQGEMLRKKRREKDGHKDPLLTELSRLQDGIVKDIAQLHKETEEAGKKQSELDKVAQILGIDIFDKSPKSSNDSKESTEKPEKEKSKSPEKELSPSNSSSNNKESKANEKSCIKSPSSTESLPSTAKQSDQPVAAYEYYDAGNHWCKDCNTICGTMFDFFTHMHNKKHTQGQSQKSSHFQKEGLKQTFLFQGCRDRNRRDYGNDVRSCGE